MNEKNKEDSDPIEEAFRSKNKKYCCVKCHFPTEGDGKNNAYCYCYCDCCGRKTVSKLFYNQNTERREKIIEEIEKLFPVDSRHQNIRKIGRELLLKAIMASFDWRKLPCNVLSKYYEVCIEKYLQLRSDARNPWVK